MKKLIVFLSVVFLMASCMGKLVKVTEVEFWKKARYLILEDIVGARKKLELPIELNGKYYKDKSLTLDEILELFFSKDRNNPIEGTQARDIKRNWNELCI